MFYCNFLFFFFFNKNCIFCFVFFFSDPRTTNWFLMTSPWPTIAIVALYMIFVYGGQRWMKNRPAYALKDLMLCYNFCLVILNAYIFYEVGTPCFNIYCIKPTLFEKKPPKLYEVCEVLIVANIFVSLLTVFFYINVSYKCISNF